MYVYKILNKINNKIYVGKTIFHIETRFKRHCYLASIDYDTSIFLYRSIRKYGSENFLIENIDTADSLDELNEKEKYWIKELNSLAPNGYNMTYGGDGGCPELSSKYWESRKVHSENMKGELNPFFGKTHSDKTKNLISQKNIGKKRSKEVIEKLRALNVGKKMSKESIEKGVNKRSKEWIFINPKGETIKIYNLSKFCRENNLDQGNMARVAAGEQKQSKGYTKPK